MAGAGFPAHRTTQALGGPRAARAGSLQVMATLTGVGALRLPCQALHDPPTGPQLVPSIKPARPFPPALPCRLSQQHCAGAGPAAPPSPAILPSGLSQQASVIEVRRPITPGRLWGGAQGAALAETSRRWG